MVKESEEICSKVCTCIGPVESSVVGVVVVVIYDDILHITTIPLVPDLYQQKSLLTWHRFGWTGFSS